MHTLVDTLLLHKQVIGCCSVVSVGIVMLRNERRGSRAYLTQDAYLPIRRARAKLCCLVTEADGCEQFPRVATHADWELLRRDTT